jgi:hypothetical protein
MIRMNLQRTGPTKVAGPQASGSESGAPSAVAASHLFGVRTVACRGAGIREPPVTKKIPSRIFLVTTEKAQAVSWWLLTALVGIGTLIRIPQLSHSLFESYAFRQTQTAFVIRKYATDGIDLLSTPLPIFGKNSNAPMEFPLFQALGALLVHTGLSPDVAARVLALVSFQASALLLALILLRWHGRLVAVVAIALFEFLPFGLFWGTASLIDFFSVALALTMVYLLDRWFNGGSALELGAGSLAAVLAFLVKPTTAPSWSLLLLVSAAIVIDRVGWRVSWKRIATGFLLAPGSGLLAAAIWTGYADSIKQNNPLTKFIMSTALRDWNFGTLAQRMDPTIYFTIIGRITGQIAGPGMVALLLGVVAAIVLPDLKNRLLNCGWFIVAFSAPVVFLNLYFVHTYYLIAIYPALVTVMAIGIVFVARLIPGARWQHIATAAVVVVAVFVTTLVSPDARDDITGLIHGRPVPASLIGIRDLTPPISRIIMVGCDWDPSYLYYAQREGVMFRDSTPGSFWRTERIADYPFLFSCADRGLNPQQWLPPGYRAVAESSPGLYRVVRNTQK